MDRYSNSYIFCAISKCRPCTKISWKSITEPLLPSASMWDALQEATQEAASLAEVKLPWLEVSVCRILLNPVLQLRSVWRQNNYISFKKAPRWTNKPHDVVVFCHTSKAGKGSATSTPSTPQKNQGPGCLFTSSTPNPVPSTSVSLFLAVEAIKSMIGRCWKPWQTAWSCIHKHSATFQQCVCKIKENRRSASEDLKEWTRCHFQKASEDSSVT